MPAAPAVRVAQRRGPAPRDRYERLNPGAKAKRHALAALPIGTLADYCREVMWADFEAGRLRHTRAVESLAYVAAEAVKHGAYAMGIAAMADLTGVSPRTVIRGSKDVRERAVSGRKNAGYLWRTRGRKGEGVTIWRPGHALIEALAAVRARRHARREAVLQRKAARADLDRAIAIARDTQGRNASQSQCDTVAHVAAPRAAGRGEGEDSGSDPAVRRPPVANQTTVDPDKPDRSGYLAAREALQASLFAKKLGRALAR